MKVFKSIAIICSIVASGLLFISCDSFLDHQPTGVLSESQIESPKDANKLVTAAYAMLANGHWQTAYISEWAFGDVRSDDAYKGGGGVADQATYNSIEVFNLIRPSNPKIDNIWWRLYVGVQRANAALAALEKLENWPKKKERIAEMRFLRGTFYYYLKILFKHIPWVTEDMSRKALKNTSNVKYTSQQLWDKIANDFLFAVKNLSANQSQVGRANKYAAMAFLARVRLYQAYVQNKHHQVTSIDKDKLRKVVKWTSKVINSGKYRLYDHFAKNFLWKYDNGKESIFAVQYSINDGTREGRINMEVGLNYPMMDAYGCCWFHVPSQNLVNAFRTGKDGLPMFFTYNDVVVKDQEDRQVFFANNTFDPRLDHTVAIPGSKFKYQEEVIYNVADHTRTPAVYGPYSPEKEIQKPSCPCFTKSKGYPYPTSSKNWDILRYDMVLLWKAEALIELGREDAALPLINKVRMRAKHSKKFLKLKNGTYATDYHIEPYKPGVNCTWTQKYARRVVRWEQRLEFAMEGIRFFALVRWGIADSVINNYFKVEKKRHAYLKSAHFTKGRDAYLPIPQRQIEYSNGLYEQNPEW